MLPEGAILIAMNGQGKTRGTVAMNKIPLTCNQSIAAVINTGEVLSSDFLFHYLDRKYDEIRKVTGGGRNGLNLELIRKFNVPVLNIEKQIRISHIFNELSLFKRKLTKKLFINKALLSKIIDSLQMQSSEI